MSYVSLIIEQPLIWTLFLIYMVATGFLAWLGHKRTTGIKSFAVGNGDMNPVVVGITLAASIASTATFVINPGFVYVHGVSALLHYGVAVSLGIIIGLVGLSPGFRRIGQRVKAVTLPEWVGQRYQSPAMGTFFALVSLLSFAFMVLIVGGLAVVMQSTLGLGRTESALLIITFVFGYVCVGGAYAHAYTNTLQGILVGVIALVIVGSGLPLLFDGGLAAVAEKGAHLTSAINSESTLYSSFFSVWVAGFVVGFAVILQPHILIKALYVRTDVAVREYLMVAIAVSVAFTGLLLVGLYAHMAGLPNEAFLDPVGGQFAQDRVMVAYITHTFSPTWTALITVAVLAAGMSTLDGLLVATSSIAGNDLFLKLAPARWMAGRSASSRSMMAQRAGQVALVLMGIATFIVVLNPPKLLVISGQIGVYALMSAVCAPIVYGVLCKRPSAAPIFAASIIGLAIHLALYALGTWAVNNGVELAAAATAAGVPSFLVDTNMPQLGFMNPAVTATWGIIASMLIGGIGMLVQRDRDEMILPDAATV